MLLTNEEYEDKIEHQRARTSVKEITSNTSQELKLSAKREGKFKLVK